MTRDIPLLRDNIGCIIRSVGDSLNNYRKISEKIRSGKHITDAFINKNLEGIFVYYGICHSQDYDFYIRVFKAIISKYDVTEDYLMWENVDDKWPLKNRWSIFASMMVAFLTCTDDDITIKLFNSDVVRDYLSRFHCIFSYVDKFDSLRHEKLSALLEIPCYQTEVVGLSKRKLNHEIIDGRLSWTTLPYSIFYNPSFIKKLAHNIDSEEYSYIIDELQLFNDAGIIDELHDGFCDKTMSSFDSKKRYFPFLKEASFKDEIRSHTLLLQAYDNLSKQLEKPSLIFEEFSKYLIIGFIFSRFFKTPRYNLAIDMKKLVDYIDNPLRKAVFTFDNADIYYQLVNYKDVDIKTLVALYEALKSKDIMSEFYDDWHKAQQEIVMELNANTLNGRNLGIYNELLTNTLGVPVYELNGQDYYMITRNTSLDVRKENIKAELDDKRYSRSYLSLSIQDQKHLTSYYHDNHSNCRQYDLKFVYGSLDEQYLGMFYCEDAYTNGISSVEYQSNASRLLLPLPELMENTNYYNDITYYKRANLQPVAILCEDEINPEQARVAITLNLPIILRYNTCYKEEKQKKQIPTPYIGHYRLFKYSNI